MTHGMTPMEERTFSFDMSPQELILWHGMGACVHPTRLADLKAALARQAVPDRRGYHTTAEQLEVARSLWNADPTLTVSRPIQKKRVGRPGTVRNMPTEWNGVLYPSKRQAALAAGMDEHSFSRRLRGMGTPGGPESGAPKPVVFAGVKYRSISDAAKVVGVHYGTLSRWIRKQQGQGAENGATTNGSGKQHRILASGTAA